VDKIMQGEMDRLGVEREFRRRHGRITFDCFELKSSGKGRVYCSKGRLLGRAKDGSMDELSILRGITSGACKDCPDYND